jgi:hypothetical protein
MNQSNRNAVARSRNSISTQLHALDAHAQQQAERLGYELGAPASVTLDQTADAAAHVAAQAADLLSKLASAHGLVERAATARVLAARLADLLPLCRDAFQLVERDLVTAAAVDAVDDVVVFMPLRNDTDRMSTTAINAALADHEAQRAVDAVDAVATPTPRSPITPRPGSLRRAYELRPSEPPPVSSGPRRRCDTPVNLTPPSGRYSIRGGE